METKKVHQWKIWVEKLLMLALGKIIVERFSQWLGLLNQITYTGRSNTTHLREGESRESTGTTSVKYPV